MSSNKDETLFVEKNQLRSSVILEEYVIGVGKMISTSIVRNNKQVTEK